MLLAALLLAAVRVGESDDSPPNFVLVLADDQGWGDIGYNAVPERTCERRSGCRARWPH